VSGQFWRQVGGPSIGVDLSGEAGRARAAEARREEQFGWLRDQVAQEQADRARSQRIEGALGEAMTPVQRTVDYPGNFDEMGPPNERIGQFRAESVPYTTAPAPAELMQRLSGLSSADRSVALAQARSKYMLKEEYAPPPELRHEQMARYGAVGMERGTPLDVQRAHAQGAPVQADYDKAKRLAFRGLVAAKVAAGEWDPNTAKGRLQIANAANDADLPGVAKEYEDRGTRMLTLSQAEAEQRDVTPIVERVQHMLRDSARLFTPTEIVNIQNQVESFASNPSESTRRALERVLVMAGQTTTRRAEFQVRTNQWQQKFDTYQAMGDGPRKQALIIKDAAEIRLRLTQLDMMNGRLAKQLSATSDEITQQKIRTQMQEHVVEMEELATTYQALDQMRRGGAGAGRRGADETRRDLPSFPPPGASPTAATTGAPNVPTNLRRYLR
jgi:hypothetical protein